jgi:hypothetical protein
MNKKSEKNQESTESLRSQIKDDKTGIKKHSFLPGSILFYQVELLIGKVDRMGVEQPHNVGFGECSL